MNSNRANTKRGTIDNAISKLQRYLLVSITAKCKIII